VRDEATPETIAQVHKYVKNDSASSSAIPIKPGLQGQLLSVDADTGTCVIDVGGGSSSSEGGQQKTVVVHPCLVELVEESFKAGEKVTVLKGGITATVERLAPNGFDAIILGAAYTHDQLAKLVSYKEKCAPYKVIDGLCSILLM
jgi:hypothetical protein